MELADLSYETQLKYWRRAAKHQFRKLYTKAIRKGRAKNKAIAGAVYWINTQMGKTINWQTMDNLDIQECQRLIELVEPHVKTYM